MVNGLPDATRVVFDDERAVANAGVLLPALLAGRLGIEALVDRAVDLGDRPGAANPGRKVMTLVSAMALGAACIDDCDVLRSGQTRAVLGHELSAPSTLGTFLRAFTFGHVRQFDRVLADSLCRAWTAGAGPGEDQLVVDVDSFVGEVYGYAKQGAGTGTPTSAGITRSSRPARRPARCCTSAPAKGQRTPLAARCGSSKNLSPVSGEPARRGRSCCAPTRVLEHKDHDPVADGRLELLDRGAPAVAHHGRDHGDCGDRLGRAQIR